MCRVSLHVIRVSGQWGLRGQADIKAHHLLKLLLLVFG